jgi:hypothetical protein
MDPGIRSKELTSMRRIVPAFLLVIALVIGGGVLVNTAYQAGLNTAVTTAAASGATVVAPAYGWGYGMGYGWHPFGFGFGIFGFLFGLFFLFLIFGLIRAIFWGGRRGWRPGGWGGRSGWSGPGQAGDSHHERNPWIERFGPSFEEWHRNAHEGQSSNEPPPSTTTSKPA